MPDVPGPVGGSLVVAQVTSSGQAGLAAHNLAGRLLRGDSSHIKYSVGTYYNTLQHCWLT